MTLTSSLYKFVSSIKGKVSSTFNYVTTSRPYTMASDFSTQYFFIVFPMWLLLGKIALVDERLFITALLNKFQNGRNNRVCTFEWDHRWRKNATKKNGTKNNEYDFKKEWR